MVIEFIGGLWIGKSIDRNCDNFLSEKGINITINCSEDLSFLNNKKEYNNIILQNIKRYEDIRLSDYLYKITDYIYTNLKINKNILIYCKKNEDFYLLILLAYLLRYGNINLLKSIEIIRTKIINSFNTQFIYKSAFIKFMKKI